MATRRWLFASTDPKKESTLFFWMLEVCAQQSIELDVVVVLPELSHKIFEWFEAHHHDDLMQNQIVHEHTQRQSWIETAKNKGVKLTIDVRFGKFFYEVLRVVNQTDVELLIKQSGDLQRKSSIFFQSDDWHLLRKSPVPLLLYRANGSLPFQQVMASLDVDIEIQPYQFFELNQRILDWASRFNLEPPLKVVHAWQSDVENLVRHWNTDISETELIELNEKIFYQHDKALQAELKHYSPFSDGFSVYYCKGEPAETIADIVRDKKVDLLVLGSLARDGIPGMLIGNTAEDLLEMIDCSVLAIKPATFKTPII